MALANLGAYLAALAQPQQAIGWTKSVLTGNSTGANATNWYSSWTQSPFAGAAPTAAASCTRTTTGALGQSDPATELRMYIEAVTASVPASIPNTVMVMFYDRLVHMGGLDGTSILAQTVGTTAIPRYTASTDRICAALEVYGTIGATGVIATCSYTNQSGAAAQTSPGINFGGTSMRQANGAFCPISLAAGDTGFSSIETVTLSASTLTAGNFGVTIYKPLLMIPIVMTMDEITKFDPVQRLGGLMPLIQPGACIGALVSIVTGTTAQTVQINAKLNFFED